MMSSNLKLPSRHAAQAAKVAFEALHGVARARSQRTTVRVGEGAGAVSVGVPADAFRLFLKVLDHMAKGNAVTIVPVHAELTTQEAADILNVSRPHLVRLLDDREIPHHMVGTHRRVRASDLLRYKQQLDDRSRDALDALSAEAQELELGY
jgi:excisionase family DNA binding protein